jgi:hypothetical protein
MTFAGYIKGDEQSFTLPKTMKALPQYVYHLRRSQLIKKFGISLDEVH